MLQKCGKCILASILSVMLIVILSGCRNATARKENSIKPQTLSVIVWGGQTREDSTNAAVKLFEQEHPGVNVEVEIVDFSDYLTKLKTLAITGELPDVVQLSDNNLYQFVNNKSLMDLSPYVKSGNLDLSTVASSSLESAMFDSGLYAIPAGINATVFAYRQDVLDECGLTMPERLTWSEYIKMSETIYEKTGRQNHLVSTVSTTTLSYYLSTMGMKVYNDTADGLGFDDPSILVDMWKGALYAVEKGFAPGVGENTAGNDMFGDEVWGTAVWSNSVETFEMAGNCTLELRELPWADDSELPASCLRPAMYWGVTENSEVKDLAVEFIDFFTNEKRVYDIVGIDRGIPVSEEVRQYMSDKAKETDKKIFDVISYLSQEGMAGPFYSRRVLGATEVGNKLVQVTEKVIYGLELDLDKAAKDWMEWANKTLAEFADEAK